MSHKGWRRTAALLTEALEQPASLRESFLAQRCKDPERRRIVAELLELEEQAEQFLEVPAPLQAIQCELDEDDSFRPGKRLGQYQIMRELGRGGMSDVYLARDAAGRLVALKSLKRGVESEDSLYRFNSERRILAALRHPGIAKLMGGGTSPRGCPYLALEYVEGTPIDTYCEQNHLSIRERIRLFCRVCEAVQYAHRQFIVHLDLKPANILVTRDGAPKLLDFGIARLLGPQKWHDQTMSAAKRMMTPQYASPEQMCGRPISAASDIYSLGVILFKLLTARLPYRMESGFGHAAGRALLRPRLDSPSEALGRRLVEARKRAKVNPSTFHQSRVRSLARLRAELRGDLDAILLKALRTEPEQRYRSAHRFCMDLTRFQHGMPVDARRNALSYKAGKFLMRHRLSLFSAAIMAAVAFGFAAAAVLYSAQAEKLEGQIAQLSGFVTSLFDIESNGWENADGRELLEQAEVRLKSAGHQDAVVRAALMDAVGKAHSNLHHHHSALQWLVQAHELRSREFGDDHPQAASSLAALGRTLHAINDLEGSEKHFREALEKLRKRDGERSPEIAQTLIGLGFVLHLRGHSDEAFQLSWQGYQMQCALLGVGHRETAQGLAQLARIHFRQGNLYQARQLSFQAVETLSRNRPDNLQLARALRDWASTELALSGEEAEVEEALRESMRIFARSYGWNSDEAALCLSLLAEAERLAGRRIQAEQRLAETLQMLHDRNRGRSSLAISIAMDQSRLLAESGRLEEALQTQMKNVEYALSSQGEFSPEAARAHATLAWILHEKGQLAQSEAYFRRAFDVLEAIRGSEQRLLESVSILKGRLLNDQGRFKDACAQLQQPFDRMSILHQEGDWRLEEVRNEFGLCMAKTGNRYLADVLLRTSLEKLEASKGAGRRRLERARRNLKEFEQDSRQHLLLHAVAQGS